MGAGTTCGRTRWGHWWSSLGGTKRVRGLPKWRRRCHANPATGAFGGAPYGATIRVKGALKWGWNRVRTLPLGPSVELPMGPRSAVLGRGTACDRGHWGLRRSSLWGREPCEGCANMGRWCHADPLAGAFGGGFYGAANRVRGVPKWGSMGGGDACERTHWSLRWSSLWGHEPCEGCAELGRAGACELRR